MLARMMVRSDAAHGDHEAITNNSPSDSNLTVSPRSRPVNTDEAA
jgi:hypothetical protein